MKRPLTSDEEAARLRVAYAASDDRAVLQSWDTMKKFDKMPTVSLPHVVESMQRFKIAKPVVLQELQGFFQKFPSECDMSCINDLLESLAKRLDSKLMEEIMEMLPSLRLEIDARTYEVFLNMYFTTSSLQEVKSLVAQMVTKRIPFNERSVMVVVKNAFDKALPYFRKLKSADPAHLVSQMVELACKDQGVRFSDSTYCLLIKAVSSEPARVEALIDEFVERCVEITPDIVNSVLACCAQTANAHLADRLYKHMKPLQGLPQRLGLVATPLRASTSCRPTPAMPRLRPAALCKPRKPLCKPLYKPRKPLLSKKFNKQDQRTRKKLTQKLEAAEQELRNERRSVVRNERRLLQSWQSRLGVAELAVEVAAAAVETAGAEESQMSEEDIKSGEELVKRAREALTSVSSLAQRKPPRDRSPPARNGGLASALVAMGEELIALQKRLTDAQKKVNEVSGILKCQQEGLALQNVYATAHEKVDEAEQSLDQCGKAELSFLKGIELLPAGESEKAIKESETAASACMQLIAQASSFVKQKLQEVKHAKKATAELMELQKRCDAMQKKLTIFETQTAKRKVAAEAAAKADIHFQLAFCHLDDRLRAAAKASARA